MLLLGGCGFRDSSGLDDVNDFCYQLQDIDPAAIAAARYDLAIIDYSADGSEELRFRADDVGFMKAGPGGPKVVLAYVSIGEAEAGRWYWDEAWDADEDGMPDPGAPVWLGEEDRDLPGNYAVRYWEPGWQAVMHEYLDSIIAAGFDGACFDFVDAFYHWGTDGESDVEYDDAEQRMVDLVRSLADYARRQAGKAGFVVVVQDAEELGEHRGYVAAVDGILREDVFFVDDEPRLADDILPVLEDLDRFQARGRAVLVLDYCREPDNVDELYAWARARGYVPHAADRGLDQLIINPGHEPD